MEMYGLYEKNIPRKMMIVLLELLFLGLSYLMLFYGGSLPLIGEGLSGVTEVNFARRLLIFLFSSVVFLRMLATMFLFLKRKIPWEEAFSIPLAFALYYLGFAWLVNSSNNPLAFGDVLAVVLFLAGSFLNTVSEWQRERFKSKPENKGKLFTGGLFGYAMHINYFGDLLWVSAYALVTQNLYSAGIVLFLLIFFVFFNIPKLDAYLAHKYKEEFPSYAAQTKKLVPFLY